MSLHLRPRTLTMKVDLYDDRDRARFCRAAADQLGVDPEALARDLDDLTELLEHRRDELRAGHDAAGAHAAGPDARRAEHLDRMTPARRRAAEALLARPDLIQRLTALLGRAGIVGEERNRTLLLLATSSYKSDKPLHVLIQGSSGSGKTRLLDVVANCLPTEDVRRYTRVTDNALYNQPPDFFRHTAFLLEDLDGLREEAEYAYRELQSLGVIRVVKSVKDDRTGQISGAEALTRGPVASAACTTRGSVYEDNLSRCLVVAVDESPAQTARVVNYQDRCASGAVDPDEIAAARQLIADAVRLLEPCAVVNPFAGRVALPDGVHKARRLHELYLAFVAQVAWWHQRQRERDARGRLVATAHDLRQAAEVLFEAILLKADELDGSLRRFYEAVKDHLAGTEQDTFAQRELRAAVGVSQTLCSRRCAALVAAEYLTVEYPGNNRRKRYRLCDPDDYGALRQRIRRHLDRQVDALAGDAADDQLAADARDVKRDARRLDAEAADLAERARRIDDRHADRRRD